MLCGLKHKQVQPNGVNINSKKRKPLSCISNQPDENKKTFKSSRTASNQSSYSNYATIDDVDKENLPVALSQLRLIPGQSKTSLPLDRQVSSLVTKYFENPYDSIKTVGPRTDECNCESQDFSKQTVKTVVPQTDQYNDEIQMSSKQPLVKTVPEQVGSDSDRRKQVNHETSTLTHQTVISGNQHFLMDYLADKLHIMSKGKA